MHWNNELQKAIIGDWVEGIQSINGSKARRLKAKELRKKGLGTSQIAKELGVAFETAKRDLAILDGEIPTKEDSLYNSQELLTLRKNIAKKYGLTVYIVKGLIELGATQGMVQSSGDYEKSYEPINYHELVGDLQERVNNLERKLEYLLDGVQKVLEDGETMSIHLQHLRQIGKWAKGRDALDVESRPKLAIPGKR